jgi:hypothetical protein
MKVEYCCITLLHVLKTLHQFYTIFLLTYCLNSCMEVLLIPSSRLGIHPDRSWYHFMCVYFFKLYQASNTHDFWCLVPSSQNKSFSQTFITLDNWRHHKANDQGTDSKLQMNCLSFHELIFVKAFIPSSCMPSVLAADDRGDFWA